MAIPSTMVWEANASGSASNGGGFDSAGTGTDRSQSTIPYVEIEQSAVVGSIQATTTNFKFTLGYTVTSADVGNVVYFSGSGAGGLGTVGHYHIVSISGSDTWVLDRSCGTSGGVPTGSMGGAKSHPVDLITTTTPVVAGNQIYCKGAFNISATTITLPAVANVRVSGYTTTRNDGSRPTWTTTANSVTQVTVNSGSATGWLFQDIIFDGDGGTRTTSRGVNMVAGTCAFINCRFRRFNNNAVTTTLAGYYLNCEFLDCTSNTVFQGNTGNNNLVGCRFAGNTVLCYSGTNTSRNTLVNCLFHDNTGTTTDGIQSAHAGAYFNISNCTIDGCGRHGINLSTVASLGHITNCLLTNNGVSTAGYGISTTATNPPIFVFNCAFQGNTTGETTGLDANRVSGSTSLSGDPYIDRSSDDYRLDNTSGEGAACKGTGYPAQLNSFDAYINRGSFGTQNGGGSATRTYAWVGG